MTVEYSIFKNSQGGSPGVMTPKVVTMTQEETWLAPRYRVLIHNDDVTPMDFVVHVLMSIFKKELNDAMEIMLAAHNSSVALVVVLPLEEAELRVEQAHALARPRKFPLTFTYESE